MHKTEPDWKCPFCGQPHNNADDYYIGEGEHEVYCNECGKEFVVSVYVRYSYRVFVGGEEVA